MPSRLQEPSSGRRKFVTNLALLSVFSSAPVFAFTSPRSTRLKSPMPLVSAKPVSAAVAATSWARVEPAPTFIPNSFPPARPAFSTAFPVVVLLPT